MSRLDIYAALRVPDVWRYSGTTLTVLLLGPDGTYTPATASLAFPTLSLGEVERRLQAAESVDQATWLREWLEWVRANVAS